MQTLPTGGHRPFIRSALTTSNIMFCVLLALLPSAGVGIYYYGLRAALVMGLAVASAVLAELFFALAARRRITAGDYSAAVTGLMVGLILPPGVPWYFPVLASVCAIVPVKMAFGGIGCNLFNPAMAGKLVLLLLFRTQMQDYSQGTHSALTPLTQLANGNTIDVQAMLFGDCAGPIGTGSALAIGAGACFLMAVGVLDLLIPAGYLAVFVLLMSLFGGHGADPAYLIAQVMGGGLLFTAFFMATDYTTSPVTIRGRVLYGAALGALTAAFRLGGAGDNAVVPALLLGNALVPLIDRYAMPRPFGTKRRIRTVREGRGKIGSNA